MDYGGIKNRSDVWKMVGNPGTQEGEKPRYKHTEGEMSWPVGPPKAKYFKRQVWIGCWIEDECRREEHPGVTSLQTKGWKKCVKWDLMDGWWETGLFWCESTIIEQALMLLLLGYTRQRSWAGWSCHSFALEVISIVMLWFVRGVKGRRGRGLLSFLLRLSGLGSLCWLTPILPAPVIGGGWECLDGCRPGAFDVV